MLIFHNGKTFAGLLLGVSFFVILALFFVPVFKGQSGLELSDRLFNRLAKGSSYFVPELSSELVKFENQEIAVNVIFGINTGTFHVILRASRTYNFASATLRPADTESMVNSLRQALQMK